MDTQKEQIFIDQPSIDRQTVRINNTLRFITAIYDAYNALLPNVSELDTAGLKSIFSDLPAFIQGCKEFWYNANFAEKHSEIGISRAKGFEMVNDQEPNYQPLIDAINDFKTLTYGNGWTDYAPVDYFAISDNSVIISADSVANYAEAQTLYLEYPLEFQARDLFNRIIENIQELRTIIPYKIVPIDLIGGPKNDLDFNSLHEVFDLIFPRYTNDPPLQISVKNLFYRKYKEYLVREGKTS